MIRSGSEDKDRPQRDDDLGLVAVATAGDVSITVLEPLHGSGAMLAEIECGSCYLLIVLRDTMALREASERLLPAVRRESASPQGEAVVLGKFANHDVTLTVFREESAIEIGNFGKSFLRISLRGEQQQHFQAALGEVVVELAEWWQAPLGS